MTKHLVRAADLSPGDALHIRHPLNPRSEVHMTRLSDRTGLERTGISLARVPPGKESFILHAHSAQEEWVYIVSGEGRAVIGDDTYDVGPGDFLGFPCDGVPHVMRNDSAADLVYLQGGERRDGDIGRFPTLDKVGFTLGDNVMHLADTGALQSLPFSAWMADREDGGDGGDDG